MVARLAQARPDVRPAMRKNATRWCWRSAGASPELLRHLLALGVDPEQRDQDGRRALEYALGSGRWPQVAVLDPGYPLPASVAEGLADGHFAQTPRDLLREALLADAANRPKRCCASAPVPMPRGWPRCCWSSTATATCRGSTGCCATAPPPTCVDGEDSVLFQLLDRGGRALPALQRLLDRGQAVGGRGGLARFLHACLRGEHTTRGHEQLALALLERGADAFGGAPSDPPLVLAIRLGWQRLVEALLAAGADPNPRDARGHTAIHRAATLGRESALRVLIRAGALPHWLARRPDRARQLALAAGRRDLTHWLEWRGWPLPGRAAAAADLPAAAIAGDADAVQRLLELGLPVDGIDAQGCTALLRAAGGGHDVVRALLLERGADTALSARTGATPLSAAISMRHVGVVDRLLRAGADPDQALPGGVTPLMLAAALGLPELSRACSRRAPTRRRATPRAWARCIAPRCTPSPRAIASACWRCSTCC